MTEYNKLTPQEERVLLHKATDAPFTRPQPCRPPEGSPT